MRTKHFYLCLLLLVLGTANVWADKYYMPKNYKSGGNPRYTDLAAMVGQKFMIYNTAIDGNEDRTGFFYNDGVKIGRNKTKERDLYVYNEKYCFTLEAFDDDSDGTTDYYAIKSVISDTYLDIKGSTLHATPVPLYIKNWADAETAGWARSGVNNENYQYNIINNEDIDNDVFIVSSSATHIADTKHYWNGTVAGFDIWTDGHPFAFYIVNEVTSGDYLQDLHIFSRSDIYSAQVIWGCVQKDANITTSDAQTTSLLIDGDASTGISTAGNYIQFNLGDAAVQNIYIYLQRGDENYPTSVKIQACNDGTTFEDVEGAAYETGLAGNQSFTQEIDLGAAYKYIRVVNTTANATAMPLSEAYVLPKDPDTEEAVKYFDALETATYDIYGYASAQQYTTQVAEFNEEYPSAKLLSGVPLPGNKYRIYADAYDSGSDMFVNREISLGTDAIVINAQGSYAATAAGSDARKAYEWYCEQTVDGKFVFKNVLDPNLYLANNGAVSTTAYEWTFSTVETHRFGVPLKDVSGEYLAVVNDGSGWEAGVAAPQNSEIPYTKTITTTADDGTETTTTETVDGGVCTDFVFIPVDVVDGEEKKITFTANEIVKRNTVFTYNGEVYKLPFSRMFVTGDEMPTITLTCADKHVYAPTADGYSGVWVNDETTADDAGRATYADGKITFDLTKLEDGDILDLRLTIKEPFEYESGNLYLIRNLRRQATSMQAPVMRRSDSSIPVSPGQVATQGAKMYYANFVEHDINMTLTESAQTGETISDYSDFEATSLFYFEKTDDTNVEEYYKVTIRSAVTTMKCATPYKWDAAGDTWYVQPNVVPGMPGVMGYAIGLNCLDGTPNDPGDAWCSNHDAEPIIKTHYAEDDGALWEFVKVDDANAKNLLIEYIAQKTGEITTTIDGIADSDIDKAAKYKAHANAINTAASTTTDVATLVDYAQTVHMLEHEVTYALQPLPLYTSRAEIDKTGDEQTFDHPNWYYLYNVKSTDTGNKYYAKFNGVNSRMALDDCGDDKTLSHMFFFEGKEVSDGVLNDDGTLVAGSYNQDLPDNALTFDDYLQVDVHNFLTPDTTLVSKNVNVFDSSASGITTPGEGKQTLMDNLGLSNKKSWRITLEYDLANVSFNAYGSCLLAGGESSNEADPGKDDYAGEFQVYLKDDKSLVIKVNNAYDTYRFWHTQDNYSHIKVVITYSGSTIILDVYNAKNVHEQITVTRAELTDINVLTTMLPAEGATITNLNVEFVEEMNWKPQDTSGGDDTTGEKDTWYILPSSNKKYTGFAIVAKSADDKNFGWTNVNANNTEIFTDAGSADNSTWQFVKITRFDEHVDQLLEKYNTDNCVIYNEQLAALYRAIKKNASFIKELPTDDLDENYFNEIYKAIKNYTGPMPDELKAPKPDRFYTMRPAYEQSSTQLFVNEFNNVVQKDNSFNDAGEYDSRGVWLFEGTTAADGFYELDGIMLKSLHTQSYTNEFAADKVLLNDASETAVTINPVGGCVVRFQGTDNNYLRGKAVGDSIMVGDASTMSYGYASTTFERSTDNTGVTSTTLSEFNELLLGDDMQKVEVAVASTLDFKANSGNALNSSILCPNQNGSNYGSATGAEYALTFTYTNLPASFTSFNNIGLDIHALNGAGDYQYNDDYNATMDDGVTKKSRQWNIVISVGTEEGNLTEYGSYENIDIAANVGTNGNVHKVWNFANGTPVSITDGKLIVKLEISTGETNVGCFFGLSNIILSAEGDTWYIEEMPDEDKTKIYHKTKTNSVGLSSLMLGYPAKIPTGIKLYYPTTGNDLSDKFITLRMYDGTIAACTPAVMHADEGKEAETFKFYYSNDEPDDDSDKATAADDKIVIDGALYRKIVHVGDTYDDLIGEDNNVYMYLSNKTAKKFYWVYENYNADGTKSVDGNGSTNNDLGEHINVNANRAYIVVGKSKVGTMASFSLRFDGSFTTGVEEIEDDYRQENIGDSVKGIFDLQGRRLSEITAPGMYIIDGKKVVVK